MVKKFLLSASIILLFLGLSSVTFAEFSDLQKNHKNYDAIIYLRDHNIIVGYPDGTFKPAQEVNRAEFLKIVLEGSNIPIDKDDITLPFSDTQESKWFLPYVKKAYDSGWIVGYADNTFKPANTINKAEALKILGEVQDWNTNENITETPFRDVSPDDWFAKYVVYAHEHNFLEKTSFDLEPSDLMKRASISEIIYRTMIENDGNSEVAEDENQENEDEIEQENNETTSSDYSEISKTYFDEIVLSENLPNTFYKNEVFIIEGESLSDTKDEVTFFIDSVNGNSEDYSLFTTETIDNHFEIPIHFRENGEFQIGIIPGTSGNTKIANITVVSSLPNPTDPDTKKSLLSSYNIDYGDDTTSLKFSATTDSIKKFTFEQNNNEVEFITRQSVNEIPLYYPAFIDFSEGNVTYYAQTAQLSSDMPLEIATGFKKSTEKTFNATEHSFDEIHEESITTTVPDKLSSNSFDINFDGTVNTDTQVKAYIITPEGTVENTDLSTSSQTSMYHDTKIIENGNDFEFTYSPSQNGRYIIELLDKDGIPIINHPIYIGGVIPLIPDYFDLNERTFFSGSFDIDDLREDILNEINAERAKHDYSQLTLDSQLNQLAQNHSEDMIENNFFGHINLEGQSPNDRRTEAGITAVVSENIAKDVSVLFAHFGLMRSGSHRENILDPGWSVVGIGVAEDDGYLYITQEFSGGAVTETDLENFKNELIDEIDNLRTSNSINQLNYNSTIENVCIYLNDLAIDENVTLTAQHLSDALDLYGVSGTSQYIGRTYSVWSIILDSILTDEESSILDATWVNIGVDIQLDETGIIYATFLLNKP